MEKKLRIGPAEVPPKKAKVSFKLPEPTITLLDAYLRAYKEMYGAEVSQDYIANEIFNDFFMSDKKFMTFVKENKIVAETDAP